MIPQLETPRLILRPASLDDAEPTQRLFPHWEVVRLPTEIWSITAEEWRRHRATP
jgi:RimJ/RimL family protein N-acetyltransferase